MPRLYAHDVLNQVKLPNNSTYDINDTLALHFLGATVTDVTANKGVLTTDEVNIGTAESPTNITVEINDVVIYGTDKLMYRCSTVTHAQSPAEPPVTASSTWVCISPKAANIGDATITISGMGVTTQTFTTNTNTDKTITVDVPVKGIKVNNTTIEPDSSQFVNIELPTDSMVFKGTVGHDSESQKTEGATLADVPTDGTAKVGDTYKVITDGTYADSISAEIGDLLVCLTKTVGANTWVLIPSGDDVDVTSVAAGLGLTTVSGNPITTTGTIKAALKNETIIGANSTVGTASDRTFAVVVAGTNTAAEGEDPVYTNQHLAVAIPAGTFATTVSDASTGNTVVTAIGTSAASSTVPTGGINPYSVSEGVLTINYITNTTSSNAVFQQTT